MSTDVTVRVKEGLAVHDGTRHRNGGEQITVPADLAARWLTAGYVEPIETTTKARQRTPTAKRAKGSA